MNRKGNILEGNVIYIILVVLFFTILFSFLYREGSNESVLEEKAAKRIALAIDAMKPGSQVTLNLEDVLEKKQGNVGNPISIVGNSVKVKLRTDQEGYEYSFFNNVKPELKLNGDNLIIIIK